MEVVETKTELKIPLEKQLERLSKDALIEWLSRFNYQVADDVQKEDLIAAIVTLHKQQLREAEQITESAVKQSENPDDPLVDMIFENVESPGASIEFTFQPPNGTFKMVNGKVRPAPKWMFYPGQKYKVPLSVYTHINSLRVPRDRVVNTDPSGFIQSLYTGEEKQNRFSARVEFTANQIKRLQETSS